MAMYDKPLPASFSELLEPKNFLSIPSNLKRFIDKADGYESDGFMDRWSTFSHAYDEAFRAMAFVVTNTPERPLLRISLFYLARHSIELHLKEAIIYYSSVVGDAGDLADHGLIQLWNRLSTLIQNAGFPVDDPWTAHCNRLVNHMHQWDAKGDRFRYPESLSGKQFDAASIDVSGLIEAQKHICKYCAASTDMLADCR